MGIGTLGFLKGASGQVLSSLEARDQAERELKKQKELEKFRADLRQQEEMKKAVTFQMYTDAETGKLKMVGYNSQNQRLDATARDATQPEIDAQKQSEEDRGWTLKERGMKEKDFEGDESERAQRMRIAANQDARSAQSSALDSQYKRHLMKGGTGGSADGSDPNDPDAINFDRAKELRYRYDKDIQNVINSGKISREAVTAASVALARESRTGSEMQQKFLEFLNRYRTTGRSLDSSKSNTGW